MPRPLRRRRQAQVFGGQGGELRQCEWVGQRRQGEFVCTAVTFGVFKHSSPNTGLVYRDCIWSLHVQRDPTYYIFKGAVPIYVIVAFAFFQFAMDVDAQLTERLNFLVALMLSSFAIQWTVTDRLPRVPSVWKSKFYGAFVLNRRVLLHAIDATPARWRGDAGSSPLDRARTAASSPSAPGALVDFHTGIDGARRSARTAASVRGALRAPRPKSPFIEAQSAAPRTRSSSKGSPRHRT